MKQKEIKLQSCQLMSVMLLLMFFAWSGLATAEPGNVAKKAGSIVITLTAQKVLNTAGKESFSAADKVKPGDVVEYRASYANVSKVPVSGLSATLPVPKGMEYLKDSARPATVLATVDGKLYQPVPLKHKVKDKTGKEVVQLVPLSDYRSLRWGVGAIPAGKAWLVSARMQVAK